MNIKSIGVVHSSRKEIVDDNWNAESTYVELDSIFSEEALVGVTDFSHVEILFYMNHVDPSKIETMARHPRNNLEWPKVGIFAQRGKNRPNQIGLTVCTVQKVEGRCLYVKGLDAVDGSPVLDIKPWMKEFGPQGSVKQPEWSAELMQDYWEKKSTEAQAPSMFDPVVLDTEHVKIRPLKSVSWQKLSEGLLYEDSFHARMWGIKTPDDIKKMYENAQVAWTAKKGNPIVFLSHDENEVLGMTNFMNVESANAMIEIGGTWINPKWQKTFVNTETKFALLKYAFETLGLKRVEFRIDAENQQSKRAVERLGFGFDGLMPRRKINANGDVRDYTFYSVTDISWPQVKTDISELIATSSLPNSEAMVQIKNLQRTGKAIEAFEKVTSLISSNPNDANLHYLAACICDADRTEAEAVPFYLKALELGLSGNTRRDAFLGLGSTYRSLGLYEKSKEIFKTGILEFPNYRPLKIFLALTEFNLGNHDVALSETLNQLLDTTRDCEIASYERALRFYSTRLNEVFN